jgi:secreted trypsin-like serine protease
MIANKLIRNPLLATLLAALVAAMVSYLVFVPNSEAAPAADGKYSPYVINGEPVPNGKYPFMSFLEITFADSSDADNRPDVFNCGGTLIDADSVLTAAHCVVGKTPRLKVKVFVGRTVLSSNQGQVRFATKASVHPRYKGYEYDAAVLQLNREVSNIKPIELATSSQNNLERPGRYVTIAGWGNTRPNAKPGKEASPNSMQEAQVPIVSDSRADKAWKDYRVGNKLVRDYVPPLMVAAGGKDRATCQGDSGGPLFDRTSGNGDEEDQRDNNGGSSGKYTQIGITSFGPIGCLVKENIPVAHTEVNAEPIASFVERATDNGDGDDDE